MMKQISISEFGGEVKFTKYIASNQDVSDKLLEAVDSGMSDYRVVAEEYTAASKRVDLVVRDSDDNVVQVVECQDANGWLDPVHASKILWYSHDKDCDDIVLITEDMTEDMRDFIIKLNNKSWVNIYVVSPTIIETDKEVDIFFKVLLRPIEPKVKSKNIAKSKDPGFREICEEIKSNYEPFFTNSAKYWVSRNGVNKGGHKRVNLAVRPQNNGTYKSEIYHTRSSKVDIETFRNDLVKVIPEYNFTFTGSNAYVYFNKVEDAVDAVKLFNEKFENRELEINYV